MAELGPPEARTLTRDALDDIAALCLRSIDGAPDRAELDDALFGSDQPAVVRGDPARGVVASVSGDGGSFVRLLAVDPAWRRRGIGSALLQAAEGDARSRGHNRLTIGADAPFFLWPGVPAATTSLLCLLEHHHYARAETNFDMTIDLADAAPPPAGPHLTKTRDRDEVDRWLSAHWPNWRMEALRALDKGNLVIERDADGISAFCAFEVNRRGFLGPVAVRPDLLGRGAGQAVLEAALHELHRRGRSHVDVVWVGPISPYVRVGARVSTVYFVYRKQWP
ncbi:MAG: hypothetical protein NVSMB12_12790 [Acidimicrobiales bacterium]